MPRVADIASVPRDEMPLAVFSSVAEAEKWLASS
jgi:hypothetical protein